MVTECRQSKNAGKLRSPHAGSQLAPGFDNSRESVPAQPQPARLTGIPRMPPTACRGTMQHVLLVKVRDAAACPSLLEHELPVPREVAPHLLHRHLPKHSSAMLLLQHFQPLLHRNSSCQ